MSQKACVLRSKLLCAVDELFVYRYCVVVLWSKAVRKQTDVLCYFYSFYLCSFVKLIEVPGIVFLEGLVIMSLC